MLKQALTLVESFCHSEAVKSIKDESYRFSSQPRLEVNELVVGRLSLTLAFPFFAEFKLPTFSKKEGVKVGDISITREDVILTALNMAKPLSLKVESEAAEEVRFHDVVNIDFEVGLLEESKQEEGIKGLNSGNIEIVIGSGMLLPVVERELIGMKVKQEGRFEITFPEFYPKVDFRNKEGFFKVKILDIKRSRPPLIVEADLPKLGFEQGASYHQLNLQLERVSQASKIDLVRNLFRRDLLATYLPKIDLKLSEYQILTNQRYMLERFLSGLESNGITLEDYLRDTGGTKESIFEELRSETVKSLKTQALLERIIEDRKITVSEEEIERYRNLLADFYNRPVEEVGKSFKSEQISSLVIDQRLLQSLMSSCDPAGAKLLEEADFFSLLREEGKPRSNLEAIHATGKSLFNLYPLEESEQKKEQKEEKK